MLRAIAWLLLAFAALLLASYGGAIFAAPLTVPVLLVAARAMQSRTYRIWSGVVVALTMAECAWALTYLAVGEAQPTIWLVPALAILAAFVAFVRLGDAIDDPTCITAARRWR